MIERYCYGRPIETGAVVKELPIEKKKFTVLKGIEEQRLSYTMEKSDLVYGLGENIRGINKRGWIYESNCADDPCHTEEKKSLYGAHNFFIVKGKKTFGIFIDNPGKITFDIGYSNYNELLITMDSWDMNLYYIEAESLIGIVKEFRQLIGRSYIPPKWAFGFGQSRWGYKNEEDIRKVATSYQENGIPIDMIYMDIDYMQDYKDFTVNEERFPNLKKLSSDLKKQGIHLVPIIDAGVKIEEGYDVYEEGKEKGYFCKEEDGTDFVAGVWPGNVHFPDFLNDEARHWFGRKYKFLLDQGIEGFWNDMNEPAIFYSQKHLEEVIEKVADYKGKNLGLDGFFEFTDLVKNIANNEEDYKRFYHSINGEKVRHDKVHNLYGYYMTKSAAEAFDELEPNKRILLFSRASYIGMHRYSGIWTGDNSSWWSHILLNLKMLPSLNMCGFLYIGADLGGFGSNATQDLVLRWTALGVFTPLMRNHSALGTREQEAYQFEAIEEFKKLIEIRYALLPYIYSEYMKAALNDDMLFKPLAFEYTDDPHAERVEDQLLVGESIMIAPVYEQNATGRYIYLPEAMKMVRMKSSKEIQFEEKKQGHHYVEIDLDEIVFFIRPDKVVPYKEAGKNVEETERNSLKFMKNIKKNTIYELYNDNGSSKEYDIEKNRSRIEVMPD